MRFFIVPFVGISMLLTISCLDAQTRGYSQHQPTRSNILEQAIQDLENDVKCACTQVINKDDVNNLADTIVNLLNNKAVQNIAEEIINIASIISVALKNALEGSSVPKQFHKPVMKKCAQLIASAIAQKNWAS